MREKRGDRTIRITKYGHWYAARQRLIAHLDGKCVVKGYNYRIIREPRIVGPDTNGHYGFGCVVMIEGQDSTRAFVQVHESNVEAYA